MAKMAHAATLPASTFLFVDEALSLDHRGWKAAPTKKTGLALKVRATVVPATGPAAALFHGTEIVCFFQTTPVACRIENPGREQNASLRNANRLELFQT
jgi:hypothetical protein